MRYLKVFENKNNQYQRFLIAQKELDVAKSLVCQFLKLEEYKDLNISFGSDNVYVEYIDVDGEDSFEDIENEDFDNFLMFLQNPDAWEEKEKYNL